MNEDHPDLQPWIEPELEARIVAAVLGEASTFEAAELERIAAERPEVALFRRRIERTHELTAAASRPDQPARRMAPERRKKLLAALGGSPVGAANVTALRRPRLPWLTGKLMLRVAAVLVVGAIAGTFFSSLWTYEQRPARLVEATRKPISWGFGPQRGADGAFSGELAQNKSAEQSSLASAATALPELAASPAGAGVDLMSAPTVTTTSGRQAQVRFKDSAQFNVPAAPAAVSALVAKNELVKDVGVGSAATPAQERSKADDPRVAEVAMLPAQMKEQSGAGGGGAVVTRGEVAELEKLGTPVTAGVSNSMALADVDKKPAPADALGDLERPVGAMRLPTAEKAKAVSIDEIAAEAQPFSTFSLNVSDVSFLLAKDALARGERPDPARIRPEEFYNAFDYGDPAPGPGEAVACRIEQGAHPFRQQRNLVRIALKVAATGRAAGEPLRLTILLDTSGSMEREDRAASVRHALAALASLLGPNDHVTLIGFARQPRLLAEALPGDQATKLADIAAQTPADGGTNLDAALALATELAGKQRVDGAQNRIVLLTDGAANLGNADPEQLALRVEKLRQQGIAFDACGVGASGFNDDVLEALTRKGDGRYYFLEKPEDADAGFARRLAGAFRPAAENVKVQVRFNPQRVGKYRLLGFEKHRLETEDFRNDRVDAAELAANEAGVALYEVEPLPGGEGEFGEVSVRFRDPASGAMVERSWTIPYDAQAPAFDHASPSLQLAGAAALLAEKLRGGPGGDLVDLDTLVPLVTALRGHYPQQARVADLVEMFRQLRR
jgi:Mg-chelatase subunit ChlD